MMTTSIRNIFQTLVSRLSKNRYQLLATFLFYKFLVQATDAARYGDFWHHAAAVNALIANALSPSHPFFSIMAPHAFLSPYSAMVAGYAALTHTSGINALETFGLINFCLFAYALFAFYESLVEGSDNANKNTCAFYGLLLILFLWGKYTWGFSGFLNFSLIADVLPYPSTFALALSFLGLSFGFGIRAQRHYIFSVLTFTFFGIVLLTHALTAIFFAVGLVCQLWSTPAPHRQHKILVGIILGSLALYATTLWPYFSIIALTFGAGDVYHGENHGMYLDVLSKIWPTIIALPFAAWALKSRAGQSILLIILVLSFVYLYGGLTAKYSFGRVISIIIILMQILIAVGLARLEQAAISRLPALATVVPLVLFTTLVYLSLPWLSATTSRALTVANSIRLGRPISLQHSYKDLLFLKEYVGDTSVVLSDIETSWIVPSMRGKVVGALHPQAFVADQKTRFNDVNLFFEANASPAQRLELVKKYHPDFLLLNKYTIKDYITMQEFFVSNNLGVIVYDSDHYVLLKLSLAN